MTRSLTQAQKELGEQVRASQWPQALALCNDILAAVPTALEPRFALADIYAKAGHRDHAVHLYGLLASHCTQAGLPLRAAVALKALQGLGAADPALLRQWALRYAAASAALAKIVARPPAPDPESPVPALPPPASLDEAAQLAFVRACIALDLPPEASTVAPIPLLSELSPQALLFVYEAMAVQRLAPSELLIEQGQPGQCLCLIASGEVIVFTTDAHAQNHQLARLSEGTLLGEMALVSDDPRSASVIAATDVTALVIDRQALAALGQREAAALAALDRFARERVLKNLLASSPLFQPFSAEQRAQLLARFEGVEYDAGAVILPEGQPGPGLFIVLLGLVEVSSQAEGGQVPLARLRSGEVFGEMSLLTGGPTSATVTAVTPTTTLFLPKQDFTALVEGVPALLAHFATLANHRAAAQSVVLGRTDNPQDSGLLL